MLALTNFKEASCHHHVCNEKYLYRSCCLHMGGGCPPSPPLFSTPSTFAVSKKRRVITMRDGYADHFVCKWGALPPPASPLAAFFHGHPCLTIVCHFRPSFSMIFIIALYFLMFLIFSTPLHHIHHAASFSIIFQQFPWFALTFISRRFSLFFIILSLFSCF